MNRISRLIVAGTFAAGAMACDSKKETPAPTAAVTPPSGDKPATPPPAEKPAEKAADSAHVVYTTVLKREGSDKPKVEDAKGKQVANWLATLYRGEKLAIVSDDGGDWVKVKTSGEVEGFVKRPGLLIAPDVSEATVLEATDAFDRPDLLALNSKKKVNAGALIFVVKNREQFSEVNATGTGTVWVLNGKLTTDKDELAVAKLLAKARSLKDSKDEKKTENINDLISLAKNNFGTTKLVSVMETELNAPAPEAAPTETAASPQ